MTDRTRVMLITGAAGGIGSATVHYFTEKGWQVIGVDRNEFGGQFPASGLFIQANIANPADIEIIYQKAFAFSPVLDAVVNNAAVQVSKPLVETSVEEWDEVIASNLRSVFLGAKLAYPMFKQAGGGALVNVSSVHAIATSANIAAYAASKGGLLALTRAMAIEFAHDNIRVNAILPGAIRTDMFDSIIPPGVDREAFYAEMGKVFSPMQRMGTPDDIAGAALFLASGLSGYVTGDRLLVGGGSPLISLIK